MMALIPARAGSTRIPGKNRKLLAGIPLAAYTIQTALDAGLFESIWVCTDDPELEALAIRFSVNVCRREPVDARQPDIVWVRETLRALAELNRCGEAFAILRPTSPFRTVAMLQRARQQFLAQPQADSLRAVEPVTEHPGKMWAWHGEGAAMHPLLANTREGIPWHSCPTQVLPPYFKQNASLEMAWTRTVHTYDSISGPVVYPFFTEFPEGVDLNTPADWTRAETWVATGQAVLPTVDLAVVSPHPPIQSATDFGGSLDLRGGL